MEKLKIQKILKFAAIYLWASTLCAQESNSASYWKKLGGSGSIADASFRAFSYPFPALSRTEKIRFQIGDSFFSRQWMPVGQPLTGTVADERRGLGPYFNASACQSCHLRDGRGSVPLQGETPVGLIFRISMPDYSANAELNADPNSSALPVTYYGTQISTQSSGPLAPEARITVRYHSKLFHYPDGETAVMHVPDYRFTDLAFGPMPENMEVSARIAPAMIGLGLLESIPTQTILDWQDPDDDDKDGISGRINLVWNKEDSGMELGRFGWKASQPTLNQQNAGALLNDMSVTSPLFPNENCEQGQEKCLDQPSAGSPEISAENLAKLLFYTRLLAVPQARGTENACVQQGLELFKQVGCESCHRMNIRTGETASHPLLENQIIHPFTDLLLHDMGEGLADQRSDFSASGREWRTPPLWGLGLHGITTGNQYYEGTRVLPHEEKVFLLHDGRARSIEEAILWHDGEAAKSQAAFTHLDRDSRECLLAFLRSI